MDTSVKRGAIVKALAVGCRQKVMLEPLSKMIESTLDLIYDAQNLADPVEKNVERYKAIISEMYNAVNAHSEYLLRNRGNFMTRSINLDLNINSALSGKEESKEDRDSLYHMAKVTSEKQPLLNTEILIPLATPPDHLATSSLRKFILTFKDKTMFVYDALLSEKRILFAGALDCSISYIQDFIFAAASLVSPPLHGIQNKIFPYVPLSGMAKLENETGYIAGVTNPMFLQSTKFYEVCCLVDDGKMKADQNYLN